MRSREAAKRCPPRCERAAAVKERAPRRRAGNQVLTMNDFERAPKEPFTILKAGDAECM